MGKKKSVNCLTIYDYESDYNWSIHKEQKVWVTVFVCHGD